jgi:hypothetical protein
MKIAILFLSAVFSFSAFAQSTTTSASAVAAERQPGVESQPAASTGTMTPEPSSGESTAKLRDVLKNKKYEEDHLITDSKLRADEGSFYGPTVNDLGSANQPNPDHSKSPKETALSGSLGGRYRMDSTHTISAGTGLKAIHPFHGMERIDTNTPYTSYDISSRWHGIQMRNSPGVSYVTIPNYTESGEFASLDYNFSAVFDLGVSKWAIGNDVNFGYYLYNRDYRASDANAVRFGVSTSPFVKYNFTDKFSINTSVGLAWWNPRAAERKDAPVLYNNSVTQRLGLAYAFTRDIYFTPYVSFFPGKLATDLTTLNFSTIFSVL